MYSCTAKRFEPFLHQCLRTIIQCELFLVIDEYLRGKEYEQHFLIRCNNVQKHCRKKGLIQRQSGKTNDDAGWQRYRYRQRWQRNSGELRQRFAGTHQQVLLSGAFDPQSILVRGRQRQMVPARLITDPKSLLQNFSR